MDQFPGNSFKAFFNDKFGGRHYYLWLLSRDLVPVQEGDTLLVLLVDFASTIWVLPRKQLMLRITGSLSSEVFERRTSTGSEPFYLLICLDATKFVLLVVFTLIETFCPKICSKSRLKSAKSPLPVYVPRRFLNFLTVCQS